MERAAGSLSVALPQLKRGARGERGARFPSVVQRVNAERVVLLGWGRAVLLQLAHPLVAEGVAEHSTFRADARARLARLQRTVDAMLALTFGTPAEALAVARRIDAIHGRVRGRLARATGDLPAGTPYCARDPALLLWVHATFADTALRTYELFVGPLTPEERDRYCAESAAGGPLLRIPPGVLPTSYAELQAYLQTMLASDRIAVGERARELAAALLAPLGPPPLRPLEALLQLPIVGLLPARLRASYGFRWTAHHERVLASWAALSRRVLPLLPPALRYWPAARRALPRAPSAACSVQDGSV
ncbi:MAG TPA: oxygenase MpaB family protein [Chloroflexota bacterium]|jgi:uncharacterized protein (DUF2236 family)|nr:oxygenase MpaB family protein [Chloroflexota bacterium]